MGIKVITPPVGEPVGRVDCQRHLRLDGAWDSPPFNHPEDAMILTMLSAAREDAEAFTGLSLATQTLELALDGFGSFTDVWGRTVTGVEIELPRGPVQSIVSVKYVDSAGVLQTIDPTNYVLDDYSDAFWLLPADGFTWPTTQSFINAVKVRYVAGYSLPGDSPQFRALPKSIRAALLLFVEHLHKNRGATVIGPAVTEIPLGVQHMLWPHRVGLGV